jgi:hypothetical protein
LHAFWAQFARVFERAAHPPALLMDLQHVVAVAQTDADGIAQYGDGTAPHDAIAAQRRHMEYFVGVEYFPFARVTHAGVGGYFVE